MKKNAFTTIELLVVITVIGLLTAIVVANYPDIKKQLALNRAAHQLIQDIRKAQEMAMSASMESCFSPSHLAFAEQLALGEIDNNPVFILAPTAPVAKGYGIYINLSESNEEYVLYADTQGDCGIDCETNCSPECWGYYNYGDCILKTIEIQEQGIVIKQINNVNPISGEEKVSINFEPPNPTTTIKWLEGDQDEIEIVLAMESDLSRTKTVAVNRAGLIEIK